VEGQERRASLGWAAARLGKLGGYYIDQHLRWRRQRHEIAREEIFGPCSHAFFKEGEAVKIAMIDLRFAGLLWTNDLSKALKVSRALRAGTVNVNNVDGGGSKCRSAATSNRLRPHKSLHAIDKYTQLRRRTSRLADAVMSALN